MQLEDLQANAAVRGILADALVTVVSVQWFGAEALELTYKTPGGALASELLYRHDEARLEIARLGRPWSFDGAGAIPKPRASPRQKLVIFTEHRDTLSYLQERIASLLGRRESLVVIHDSMGRADRLKAQEAFRHDPKVQVLLATDAAGEGINPQRAHLMVNYDLPWNPNRLEQRFGRIHRIGQTEVCHLWNLVADETREGDVYRKLLDKLEQARYSLGGRVFDVLGRLYFEGRPLRDAVNPGCYPLGVRLC